MFTGPPEIPPAYSALPILPGGACLPLPSLHGKTSLLLSAGVFPDCTVLKSIPPNSWPPRTQECDLIWKFAGINSQDEVILDWREPLHKSSMTSIIMPKEERRTQGRKAM